MAFKSCSYPALMATLFAIMCFYPAFCTGPLEMAACASQLLLLAPCAPFVQGLMRAPIKSCCDNLADLNAQQPRCVCFVLNDTNTFPIDHTLASRLPTLCGMNTTTFACPGLINDHAPVDLQPNTLLGSITNSSIAEVPMASLNPKNTLMSQSCKNKIKGAWFVAVVVSIVILQLLL